MLVGIALYRLIGLSDVTPRRLFQSLWEAAPFTGCYVYWRFPVTLPAPWVCLIHFLTTPCPRSPAAVLMLLPDAGSGVGPALMVAGMLRCPFFRSLLRGFAGCTDCPPLDDGRPARLHVLHLVVGSLNRREHDGPRLNPGPNLAGVYTIRSVCWVFFWVAFRL